MSRHTHVKRKKKSEDPCFRRGDLTEVCRWKFAMHGVLHSRPFAGHAIAHRATSSAERKERKKGGGGKKWNEIKGYTRHGPPALRKGSVNRQSSRRFVPTCW